MKVQTAVVGGIGVIVLLVLLTLLTAWVGKKFPSDRYDECQKIARGNAYRFSFWVGGVCYLGALVLMIYGVDGKTVIEPYLLLFLCMIIQALAFHIYCFVTHAAIPFGEKPGGPIVCYAGLAFLELFDFFRRDVKEVIPLMGMGTSAWINLIMGIFFLCLAVMYLLTVLLREKE